MPVETPEPTPEPTPETSPTPEAPDTGGEAPAADWTLAALLLGVFVASAGTVLLWRGRHRRINS